MELHKCERSGAGQKVAGVSAGKYMCYHDGCGAQWRPAECNRLADVLIAVHVNCPKCKQKRTFDPTDADRALADRFSTEAQG